MYVIIFIVYLCSFKENDIISEWNFNIDTVKAAPAAAVPGATNTNRKTTKRQLLDNTGQINNQKRSSIQSDTAITAATEQLLKRASMMSKEETTSIDESVVSAVTEEVVMDLSKQPAEVTKYLLIIGDIFTFVVTTSNFNRPTEIIKIIHCGFHGDSQGGYYVTQ